MDIPIYFENSQEHHGFFTKAFEEQNYFKDKTIKILHLGAYTGHGTKWMLERVDGTCIDVDTWEGSKSSEGHLDGAKYGHDAFYTDEVEKLYDETVSGLPTIKFKGPTTDFFKQNTETFDFIYIDASHKKADVAIDLEESWKILNDNGIIACDDYLWEMDEDPELIPHYAIKEFAESHAAEIEILIDGFQFWFKKVSV
jgi:predicted O-methyltransferase YrrM